MSQAVSHERTNQKARTRSDLLASAAALIRAGGRPTVEEAALAAGISKRTAYRYFTSQEHLLADAALEALRPRMDAMLASASASGDVRERVAGLARALRQLAEEHDAELREMIRAALARSPAPSGADAPRARGGRRLDWIGASLAPLRGELAPDALQRLTDALAVCLGIDALMVLRDICGATGDRAEQLMIWMADALLDRALRDAAPKN